MFKKTIAALAVAGSLLVLAPHAAFAGEAPARPVATTEQGTTNPKADAAAQQALKDIEQRLAADPTLARQIYASATRGDTVQATRLLATDGAEVVAVSSGGGQAETARVTIKVTVTVCVRVFGTTYCGTIIVTVNLD